MDFKIEFSGDTFEDKHDLYCIMHAAEMASIISDVQEAIRRRLKYEEHSPEEDRFLEDLRSLLYLENI